MVPGYLLGIMVIGRMGLFIPGWPDGLPDESKLPFRSFLETKDGPRLFARASWFLAGWDGYGKIRRKGFQPPRREGRFVPPSIIKQGGSPPIMMIFDQSVQLPGGKGELALQRKGLRQTVAHNSPTIL